MNYDIYVGVLGARFGTATPRAGSGTEEEFETALERFRNDPTTVRLLFYFKRSALDPFALDLQQLQKVTLFRDQLSARGVLFRDFNETADFVQMVREHLHNLIVDEWRGEAWQPITQPINASVPSPATFSASPAEPLAPQPPNADDGSDDEFGPLDYMSAFHEGVIALVDAMTKIAEYTDRLNTQMNASTAETQALLQRHETEKTIGGSRAQQQYVADAKDVVNRAAAALDAYADAMAPELDRYRNQGRTVFTNLDLGTIHDSPSSGQSAQFEENVIALEGALSRLIALRDNVGSIEGVIRRIPGLTGKLKRARRRVATQLGEFIADLTFSIDKANDILSRWRGDSAA